MDCFAWNAKRKNARVISRQLKTLFFFLYPTKMKCSMLEKISCLIWRASHFIGGTLKWNILKNISDFCSSPPDFFNQTIHLNLTPFAYSFVCPFQLIKSHMKGFTQSCQSQSLLIQLQQNYFLKYWVQGRSFLVGFFFSFFSFFFLVSMIVCV